MFCRLPNRQPSSLLRKRPECGSLCRRLRAHAANPDGLGTQPLNETIYDITAVGNLCVDIFVEDFSPLPLPAEREFRVELLERLSKSPPGAYRISRAEVGGNANMMIAAARLGLKVASVGHLADDHNGRFFENAVLNDGVALIQRIRSGEGAGTSGREGAHVGAAGHVDPTLVCFVLCDDQGRHGFCSRYDFGPWPFLSDVSSLPTPSLSVLRRSRSAFINGFVLDELAPEVVLEASRTVIASGGFSMFDPGPRIGNLLGGTPRMKEALWELVLRSSSVLVMTGEEGAALTGLSRPEDMASFLFRNAHDGLDWVVVKAGGEGAVLYERGGPGGGQRGRPFRVPVVDTVGCGDSFAAALALGRLRGLNIGATLALANAVGAATATRRGAGRNVAHPVKVAELLLGRRSEGGEEAAHAASALDSLNDTVNGSIIMSTADAVYDAPASPASQRKKDAKGKKEGSQGSRGPAVL